MRAKILAAKENANIKSERRVGAVRRKKKEEKRKNEEGGNSKKVKKKKKKKESEQTTKGKIKSICVSRQ